MAVRSISAILADISTNLAKTKRGSIKKTDVFGLMQDSLDTLNDLKVSKSDLSQVSGSGEDIAMSQKGITDFVNSSINSMSAFYLTKDAKGNVFGTKAELDAATEFYYAGVLRVPTKNDYLLVNSDETHDNAPCRYVAQELEIDGTKVLKWVFQYKVNEFPFSESQLSALSSGITSALVSQINTNKSDITDIKSAKENAVNKVQVVNDDTADEVKFPSVKAVKDYVDLRIPQPPANEGLYALTVEVDSLGEPTFVWNKSDELGVFS